MTGVLKKNLNGIITNNHVVENGDVMTVTFANGKSVESEIVGMDIMEEYRD